MIEWNEVWKKVDAVFGWLSEGEAKRLYELARVAPGVCVELGAFMGRSTVALAHGIETNVHALYVISIDTWIGTADSGDTGLHQTMMKEHGVSDMFELHKRNMEKAGVAPFVRRIRGRSSVEGVEWAKEWRQVPGLVFIDACHDYEAVKADFVSWDPLVPVGGFVAFHDDWAPGPKQVIEEMPAHYGRVEGSGSLTVFQKVALP